MGADASSLACAIRSPNDFSQLLGSDSEYSLRKTDEMQQEEKKVMMMMMMMSREAIRMSMKVHKLENANCGNLMNGSVLLLDGQSATFVHQKAKRQAITYKQECLF
jgi:hypothetical protein